MQWIRRHPLPALGIAAVLLAGLAWLAFGFFGVHTLFVDDEVSEAGPVFDEPAGTPTSEATTPAPAATSGAEPAATAAPDTEAPAEAPATTVAAEPSVVTEYSGTFESRDHPTEGVALVLGNGTGQRFLRFEQFATDNGPDLHVYLVNSSAGGVTDFVDLGTLKGNVGEQNYEIPGGVDLDLYDTALIWCVRFSSPFGEATLTAA
jgi:hypothetical protein